jgi:hypothetical protein
MEQVHVVIDNPEYCLFFQSDIWWLCLEKGEWASWMQTLGALFALGFTLLQMIIAKRDAAEQKSSKLAIVNQIAKDLEWKWAQQVHAMYYSLHGEGQASRMVTETSLGHVLSDIQDLSKTIEIQNLPDPATVARVLDLSNKITTVLRIYRKHASQLKNNMDRFSTDQMKKFRADITPYLPEAQKILGIN